MEWYGREETIIMGVDIGIRKQTDEVKKAYDELKKAFGTYEPRIWNNDKHPFYSYWKERYDIIEAENLIAGEDDIKDEKLPEVLIDFAGQRWSNLYMSTPIHKNKFWKEMTDTSLNHQIYFVDDIKRIYTEFTDVYLKIYPNDEHVKYLSEFFRELINHNYMLVPC